MTSSFDRFRQKNLNQIVSEKKYNSQFILNGYPSIEVSFIDPLNEVPRTQNVSVVNRQEKDMAYVYTFQDQPLQIGDIFEAKSLILLITEEIIIIKDVDFRKYSAVICNADLGDNNWGYFKGPEKSYINTTVKEDSTSFSQQKPILVARQGYFNIHDIIKVNGRPWLIIEADTISSPTIGYYSLKATTASKAEADDSIVISQPTEVEDANVNKVAALQTVNIPTESGYFTTTAKKLNNLSVSSASVSFTVPFGISEFIVSVKQDGQVVNKVYKVV